MLIVLGVGFGQNKKYTLSGIIVDEGKQPLTGVSVVLLNPVDSVLIAFGASDDKGKFLIKNIKAEKVKVQLTYLGFGTIEKLVTFGNDSEVLDMGVITLAEGETMLNEVVIKSEFIPILIKKDTIEYNADAFRVRPNATVEELLKKLPGIEVDANGTITAQGEEIKKVTVDGKKFFGDDPKMATQNLPADAIKKVQVYEKKSEKAEFTGISDGESERVINLELKPNKKVGTFGEIMAGAGSNERFDSKLSYNKFNNKFQFSVLGNFNNLSNQGFSFSDYNTLMGGNTGGFGRGMGAGSSVVNFNNSNSGQIKSATGGLNIFYEFSPKFTLTTSYFLSTSNQLLVKTVDRENFLGTNNFNDHEDNTTEADKTGHTVNLNMQIKADSFHRIDIESVVRFNNTTSVTDLKKASESVTGLPINAITQVDNAKSDLEDLSFRTVFTKRLRKAGRVFSAEASYGNTINDNTYDVNRTANYFADQRIDSLLQEQISLSDNSNFRIFTEYKEPLGKRNYLGLAYSKRNYKTLQDKDFYNIDFLNPSIRTFDQLLSSVSNNDLLYDRAALTYTKDDEKYSINADMVYQRSQVRGSSDLPDAVPVQPIYHYFVPSLTFNWIEKNIRLRYNTNINEPAVYQLQSIVDNSDPLNIYQGNPNLKPEYAHNINLRYSFFDNFNFRNFFAFINLKYTKDKIVTAQTIDANRIRSSLPVNTDHQQSANMNLSFSSPVRKAKVKVRTYVSANLSKTINFINGVANDVITTAPRFGIDLENINNKVVSVLLGYDVSYSENKYSVSTIQNANYLTQNLRSVLLFNLGKGWNLDADVNHGIYTGNAFDEAATLTMANSALSKRLFNDRLTIKLRVADMLNAGKGITRNTGDTYVESLTTNAIGRYGLLSVSYKLSGFTPQQNEGMGRPPMMRH